MTYVTIHFDGNEWRFQKADGSSFDEMGRKLWGEGSVFNFPSLNRWDGRKLDPQFKYICQAILEGELGERGLYLTGVEKADV